MTSHEIIQSTSSDPLIALGPSLFLQILSNLPLSSLQTCNSVRKSWQYLIASSRGTLYRPIAHQIGIEIPHVKNLEALEKATAQSSLWMDPEEPPETEEPSSSGASVDWKGVIKSHVDLQNNWKFAKAKNQWIYPGRNTVWRIKVDKEEKTIITSSRLDGILISDMETSEPLFEYEDMTPYSHLEFVNGHLIFNTGDDHTFEVHITPTALKRLSPEKRKSLPPASRSATRGEGYSFPLQNHYTPSTDRSSIPPRGHLTYYKSIRPRTECFAFRARVDKEYTEDERLMFGTSSGTEAYIYNLQSENNSDMEKFVFERDDRGRPNYIEFDDDYLFICSRFSIHVYSRLTKKKIMTFPPAVTAPFDAASAIYTCFDTSKDFKKVPKIRSGQVVIGEAKLQGKWIDDAGFEGVMMSTGQSRVAGREFSALHYTSKDLFATTRAGTLYMLRNYHECLSIQDPILRDKAVNANLIAVVFRESLLQLATYGEHVVTTSPTSMFLLDTSSLPLPPYNTGSSDTRPSIRINKLLNVHEKGMGQCSCLQLDREKIYAVYWALGESEAGGVQDHDGGKILPPPEATSDFGICVKVWNFGVNNTEYQ
ncbi:uncharacterized protein IL334_002732 [Kwoniella shivajii]|uniref:F-box domain-containing protein n=1 Tax=Kwoniella shivajii TaxID=564305 RepID=A0ABZ1CVJ6_9TREE|nr:hypothetical protein IL334_002732 [Kwoniella shivajii]